MLNKRDHKFCHSEDAKGQEVKGGWVLTALMTVFCVWQLGGLQGACGVKAFHHYLVSEQTDALKTLLSCRAL